MSYTYLPETPRARPAVVTAAVALMYVAAALLVVGGVTYFGLVDALSTAMNEVVKSDPNAGQLPENFGSTFAWIYIGIFAAIYVVGAIIIAVLAIFNGKGRNWSRITTWVFAGLTTLCCGCLGASNAVSGVGNFSGSFSTPSGAGSINEKELQQKIEGLVPSWFAPVSATVSVVVALAAIIVIILLALPASNAYFRKAPETWTPPSWPGAPGDPGYPQAPGYPQVPGAQGYPQPPGAQGYPQAPGTPGYPQPPGAPGYPPAPPAPGAPGTDPGYPPPPPGGYPPPPGQ
jgi:hypothetical protein